METRSLVPHQSSSFKLPIANLRSVFRPHDVERKLAKLPDRDHENLRTTYERMLERGPERFQVKPSGMPDMAALYEQLPNFTDALDDVKRHVALSQDCRDGLEVTPMLLLGPPGIGKTHFARKLADLLGTGMSLVPMSSMTAGWLLSGASSQWKGAKPGKVFEALVDGQYANPVHRGRRDRQGQRRCAVRPAGRAVQPAGARHGRRLHGRIRRGRHRRQPGDLDHDGQRRALHPRADPEPHERVRDRGALARGGARDRAQPVRVHPRASTAGASASTPSRRTTCWISWPNWRRATCAAR